MSELLARAGALFVAPADAGASPARPVAASRPGDVAGVLAPAELLPAVAGGVAASLRHAHRAKTVLVLLPEAAALPRPAFHAARALAGRLASRDLRAVAAGGLVRVGLPDDGNEGTALAWRAIGAAGVPTVVALAQRSDGYDALLAQADELLLAPSADPALTSLALESLAALGSPAALVDPPRGVVARHIAALGLTRLAPRPTEVRA